MASSLPPWNTQLAREKITKRFYGSTPVEFTEMYTSGKLDFDKDTKMMKTLLLWYPELKA